MYNENEKMRFIGEIRDSAVDIYERVFAQVSKYEIKYNTDIGAFDRSQILDVFDNEFGINLRNRRTIYDRLVYYTNWRWEKGLSHNADIETVSYISRKYYRKVMCTSPLNLENRISAYVPPVDEGFAENLTRLYFEMGYIGVPMQRLADLTNENVDFENMSINVDGKSFPFPREFLQTIRFAVSADELRQYPRANETRPRVSKRGKGDLLFRTSSPTVTLASIKKVTNATTDRNPDIHWTYETIQRSGLFYQKYVDMLDAPKGEKVDFYNERMIKLKNGDWKTKNKHYLRTAMNIFETEMVGEYNVWVEALIDQKD